MGMTSHAGDSFAANDERKGIEELAMCQGHSCGLDAFA